MHLTSPRSAFLASRVPESTSTFVLKEYNDVYDEVPLIYVKLIPSIPVVVVIDTGCGGACKDEDIEIKSLRQFIETIPVPDNGHEALNPQKWPYIVVCTHVHFDHILAVEDFASDSRILASSNDPGFLSPHLRPLHSLCELMEVRTPEYTATLVPHMHGVAHEGAQTELTVLHTPGHTPDEIAIWDPSDGVLYVGDTLYQWAPIIFPAEGNLVDWWKSVDDLLEVVKLYNATQASQQTGKTARVAAGHVNYGKEDALEVLTASKDFVRDVLRGDVKAYKEEERRGENFLWHIREDMKYALGIPERLLEEARKKLNI